MLLGALLISAYASWARSRQIVSVAMIALGSGILAFAVAPVYWLVLIGALIVGLCVVSARTTLAAMVDFLNEQMNYHIVTLEDPLEFIHSHKNCLINQRQIGEHSLSFTQALRSALREDPNVVLVGEIPDGHKLLSYSKDNSVSSEQFEISQLRLNVMNIPPNKSFSALRI